MKTNEKKIALFMGLLAAVNVLSMVGNIVLWERQTEYERRHSENYQRLADLNSELRELADRINQVR